MTKFINEGWYFNKKIVESTEEMLYRAFNDLVIKEINNNPSKFEGPLAGMSLMKVIGEIKQQFLNAPDEILSQIKISRDENNEICDRITKKIFDKYLY